MHFLFVTERDRDRDREKERESCTCTVVHGLHCCNGFSKKKLLKYRSLQFIEAQIEAFNNQWKYDRASTLWMIGNVVLVKKWHQMIINKGNDVWCAFICGR